MIRSAALYLLRHGTAGGKDDANTFQQDFVRTLTAKGIRQSVAAGKVLAQLGSVSAAYTSPRVRCVQSAMLACAELGVMPQPEDALVDPSPADVERFIVDGKAVLVVCSIPECNDVVEHLTGRAVHMTRGTLAGVRITNGQGSLAQLLAPRDIAGMA